MKRILTSRVDQFGLLTAYVLAAAAAALVFVVATLPGFPYKAWPELIIFVALAGLTGSWDFDAPGEGGIILTFLPAFAAAVIFGPCAGALTFGIGCLVGEVVRGKPPTKVAFNSAQLALAGGLAGLAFTSARSGASLTLTSNILAYSVATAAYFSVNIALGAGAIALSGQAPVRPVARALRDGGVFYLAMVPLSALLAEAYTRSSWNLLYFPVIAWLLAKGFALHAQLRDQTGRALDVLADTIDKRDPYTYQHSLRVADHVRRITTEMGIESEEAESSFRPPTSTTSARLQSITVRCSRRVGSQTKSGSRSSFTRRLGQTLLPSSAFLTKAPRSSAITTNAGTEAAIRTAWSVSRFLWERG